MTDELLPDLLGVAAPPASKDVNEIIAEAIARGYEEVKWQLECPECGYRTLVWEDPTDTYGPYCPGCKEDSVDSRGLSDLFGVSEEYFGDDRTKQPLGVRKKWHRNGEVTVLDEVQEVEMPAPEGIGDISYEVEAPATSTVQIQGDVEDIRAEGGSGGSSADPSDSEGGGGGGSGTFEWSVSDREQR